MCYNVNSCSIFLWQRPNQVPIGRKKPKVNFAEVRTFLHLYRNFDRMWMFFILAFQVTLVEQSVKVSGVYIFHFVSLSLSLVSYCLYLDVDYRFSQAMLIIAWNSSGSIADLFNEDVFKSVLSIFITSAVLNFVQGRGEINKYVN